MGVSTVQAAYSVAPAGLAAFTAERVVQTKIMESLDISSTHFCSFFDGAFLDTEWQIYVKKQKTKTEASYLKLLDFFN